MKSIMCIAIAALCLTGPPKKAKCPFKDGIIKPLTEHHGIVIGPGESTVDIWGKDSVVLAATDGRVTDVMDVEIKYICIRADTTIYTIADIDRALVREGERVTAGQPIAIAREGRIEFYVGNYLGKIFRNPADYVDCVCQLIR